MCLSQKSNNNLANSTKSKFVNKLTENNMGIHQVEVTFKNQRSLGEFILAIQRKDKSILDYFDHDNFKVDFPHYMISVLRKMKMGYKKHTSQPFHFSNQKFMPQPFPMQMNAFGVQPQFPQMNMSNMIPLMQIQTEPVGFSTIEDIRNRKDKFMSLPDAERTKIIKKHLIVKLQKYSKLLNL